MIIPHILLDKFDVVFVDLAPTHRVGLAAIVDKVLRCCLARGFKHVFAVTAEGDPLVFEPSLHGLNLAYVDEDIRQGWRMNTVAVRVVRDVAVVREKRFNVPWNYGCVSAVKHLLGIRAWWVITPYGLYQYLTKER